MSVRTRVLFWLYYLASAIGFAAIIALLIGFAGYFTVGWKSTAFPAAVSLLVNAAIAVILLRIALYWSNRVDRRNSN